jgi:hypothetical protein
MQTDILSPSPEHLELAAEALRRGQLVAMPTETVYGLAGHGLDEAAVTQIFAVKERPHFNPLILHLAPGIPLEKLQGWLLDVSEFTPAARERLGSLVNTFWPWYQIWSAVDCLQWRCACLLILWLKLCCKRCKCLWRPPVPIDLVASAQLLPRRYMPSCRGGSLTFWMGATV